MEISKIIPGLYHGTYPDGPDYDVLNDLGIALIINMQSRQMPSARATVPIRNVWLRTNDNPITRIPIYDLARGVVAARQVLDGERHVFVHCRQGRHRSSAMVGALLVSLGRTALDAVSLIKTQRPRSNPRQWYIQERIVRFERLWKSPRTERSRQLLVLGREAIAQKDLPRAARTVRLAISAFPRNAEAWLLQADIMAQAGRDDEAQAFTVGAAWLTAVAVPA